MAIAWLVLGLLLLWFELHHLAFFSLFAAIGAFAAAIVALASSDAYIAQGLVFVGVSVLGVATLRPVVDAVYEKRHPAGLKVRGVHGGLIGQDAVTLDRVAHETDVGHALLAGERWLAISADGQAIEPGAHVTVQAVKGTTLVVWPIDHPLPPGDVPDDVIT